MVSDLTRDNLQVNLIHDFENGNQSFSEFSYYTSKTNQNNSPSAAFSSSKLIIPASNYWNPFGTKILPDGSINPNRLADEILLDVPDEGLAVLMDNYRFVDIGPRRVNVEYNIMMLQVEIIMLRRLNHLMRTQLQRQFLPYFLKFQIFDLQFYLIHPFFSSLVKRVPFFGGSSGGPAKH